MGCVSRLACESRALGRTFVAEVPKGLGAGRPDLSVQIAPHRRSIQGHPPILSFTVLKD